MESMSYYKIIALNTFFLSIECNPSFTKTPGSNNKFYVDEGKNSLTLTWDYNSDGETVTWVDLMYKKSSGADDQLIARKMAGQHLQVSPTSGYTGRVTSTVSPSVSFSADFTLWYIKKSDRRTFECKVYFTSVANPWITNPLDLIVVGKSLHQHNQYISKKRSILLQ